MLYVPTISSPDVGSTTPDTHCDSLLTINKFLISLQSTQSKPLLDVVSDAKLYFDIEVEGVGVCTDIKSSRQEMSIHEIQLRKPHSLTPIQWVLTFMTSKEVQQQNFQAILQNVQTIWTVGKPVNPSVDPFLPLPHTHRFLRTGLPSSSSVPPQTSVNHSQSLRTQTQLNH